MDGMSKVMGLDLSSNRSGYSVFVDGKLVSHGAIDLSGDGDSVSRDRDMMLLVGRLITDEMPQHVVVEDSFTLKNVQTTKHLSYIIGAAVYQCHLVGANVETLLPSQWRARVGISQGKKKRDELKKEAVRMVRQMYGFDPIEDEAEAILIGLSKYYDDMASSILG